MATKTRDGVEWKEFVESVCYLGDGSRKEAPKGQAAKGYLHSSIAAEKEKFKKEGKCDAATEDDRRPTHNTEKNKLTVGRGR